MVQDGPGDILMTQEKIEKNLKKHIINARVEHICKKSRPFCRDEWILRVRELSGRVPRGPYAIWDPFFGSVTQKCEGFSIFWIFAQTCEGFSNMLDFPFVGSNRGSGHFKKKHEFLALFELLVTIVAIIIRL